MYKFSRGPLVAFLVLVIGATMLTIFAQVSGSPGVTGSGSVTVPGTVGQPAIYKGTTLVGSSGAYLDVAGLAGYTSASDPCAAITSTLASFTLPNEGVVDARGLIPISGHSLKPCTAASTNALLASCVGGYVQLGDYTLWINLSENAAATSTLPPQGAIPIPSKCGGFRGIGRGDQNGANTTIAVCTGTNTPRAGCTAPTTREWAITTTAVSFAGGRTYLQINGSSMDLVAGEPVRVGGSTSKNNNGSWRVCNLNVANSTRTDTNCPANPTASTVYVVGVSGVVSLITATAGSGQTPGTYSVTSSGGACTTNAVATIVVQAGGTVTTSPTVTNPGVACTSAPTFTLAAGGTPATFTAGVMSACAASCGTLHGEIPVIDITPLTGNEFAQVIENMSVDCEGVADCIPYRGMSANEQTRVLHAKFSGSPERAIDIHGFNAQNMPTIEDVELYVGVTGGANCDVGTTGFFFADNGPHGMADFTVNLTTCTHTPISCGYIDTNVYPLQLEKGHCENAQKSYIAGQDTAAWAWVAQSQSGVSATAQCSDTSNGNCVPSDGPYQNGVSSVLMISPNFPPGASNPATSDFTVINLVKGSAASTNTLEDLINQGISTDNVISLYGVDYNATSACTTIASSTSTLPGLNCGLVIPVALSTSYCNSTFNAAAATYFLSGNGGGNVFGCSTEPTSGTLSVPMPVAGHIRKLSCTAGVGGKDGTDAVAGVYDNGVLTNLKCTFGTGTSCTNDTIVAIAANEKLSFGITVEATSTLSAPRCTYIVTQ